MRIWAFPSFYPYNYPGLNWTGIFAHRQYKGLIANGADLKVVYPVLWNPPYPFSLLDKNWEKYRKIAFPQERVYEGVTVYQPRIANIRPSRLMKKNYHERYVDAIVGFFNEKGITLKPETDIFYSQWLPESTMVQDAAHRLGLKSAVLAIGDDVVVWPYSNSTNRKRFEDLWVNADLRFACADYLGKQANEIIGKALPYDIVHWGVDYDFLKPANKEEKSKLRAQYNISDNRTVILNVGSAIVRKGWIDLMDALVALKKENLDFLLVAIYAGPKELNLKEEAEKRGLAANFLDLGEIPPSGLNKMFQMVDVFCLPSHWEGMANANIEAMSTGLPVITTNVCGHPELIEDGVNGILVPPKQPKILEEKLRALLADAVLREQLGKTARDFIVNKWGNFADNSKNLYKILQS